MLEKVDMPRVLDTINGRKAQLSTAPIHRLRNDILFKIFEEACVTNRFSTAIDKHAEKRLAKQRKPLTWAEELKRAHSSSKFEDAMTGPITPALSISQTSREWRYLSLHLPQLWSNLRIVAGDIGDDDLSYREGPDPSPLLDQYLRRSEGCLLTVTVDGVNDGRNWWPGGSSLLNRDLDMIEVLVDESSRWKHATLNVSALSLDVFPWPMDLPELKSLELICGENMDIEEELPDEIEPTPRLPWFSEAIKLESFILPDEYLTEYSFCSKNITSVTLDTCTTPLLRALHSAAPGLVYLSIRRTSMTSHQRILRTLCFARLESLNAGYDCLEFTGHPSKSGRRPQLFDFLLVPRLKKLKVRSYLRFKANALGIADMLTKSDANLKEFRLTGITISPQDLEICLGAMKGLEGLTLKNAGRDETYDLVSIYKVLSAKATSSTMMVPQLTTLRGRLHDIQPFPGSVGKAALPGPADDLYEP